MAQLKLMEDDLEVAAASVRFALENCPAGGVLSNEDGTSVSLDGPQTMLGGTEGSRHQSTSASNLSEDVLPQLNVVIYHASENCPVEAVANFRDGRPISGGDTMALAKKPREPSRG